MRRRKRNNALDASQRSSAVNQSLVTAAVVWLFKLQLCNDALTFFVCFLREIVSATALSKVRLRGDDLACGRRTRHESSQILQGDAVHSLKLGVPLSF